MHFKTVLMIGALAALAVPAQAAGDFFTGNDSNDSAHSRYIL